MKRAFAGARSRRRSIMRRRATSSRKIYGGVDTACRCRWSNSSVWLYAHGRHGRGQALHPLAAYLFRRRSATIMSITARRNDTARWRASRASRSTRSPRGRFGKLTGEVNLPPIRFAEVGTPAFYLSYIRPALFAGAMATAGAGRQRPPLLRSRRPARPQLHRRAAAADGVLGRRRGRVGGRPLPQDRVARLAEDHVADAAAPRRRRALGPRAGPGPGHAGRLHLARRVQADELRRNLCSCSCSAALAALAAYPISGRLHRHAADRLQRSTAASSRRGSRRRSRRS